MDDCCRQLREDINPWNKKNCRERKSNNLSSRLKRSGNVWRTWFIIKMCKNLQIPHKAQKEKIFSKGGIPSVIDILRSADAPKNQVRKRRQVQRKLQIFNVEVKRCTDRESGSEPLVPATNGSTR